MSSQHTAKTSSDLSKLVVAQQGPAPPNPIVVERFQQVVSQLFTQRIVRLGGPVDDDMANLVVAQLLHREMPWRVQAAARWLLVLLVLLQQLA